MVKNYTSFAQRSTRMSYRGVPYILNCEWGMFTLYTKEGELFARSSRFPFQGVRRRKIVWDNLRPEDLFELKERSGNMFSLIESSSRVIQEIFMVEGENVSDYNAALFVFMCTALSYHGYSPNGKVPTTLVPDELILNVDRELVILQIENNSVIVCKGESTNCAKHIRSILEDLHVNLYLKLPKEE